MIADLKPYPRMKDSGVPWLGEVPEHWEVRRLGQIGRLSKGSGGSKEDEMLKGVPCVRYGDLYTTHDYFIGASRSFVSSKKAKDYTPIRFGDVLFAASGETIEEIGKSAVNLIDSTACCGGDVILFRPKREMEPRFLGYATDCRPAASQKAMMGRGITVKHIYSDQLKYLTLGLPPLPEQSAIFQFLNQMQRRIRCYVRAKRNLIELLQEQRGAIIHRAVTRGLDPDVRLKPSSFESLGYIPEHWEVARLKNVAQVQTGLTLGKDHRGLATESRPYLRVANVQSGRVDLSEVKHVEVPQEEARTAILQDGDVLMTEGGDIDKLGRGCVWRNEIPGCLHQNHVFAVRCRKSLLVPEFLVGLMASQVGRNYFQLTAKQTTNLASTNTTTLRAFPMMLPPVEEQQRILGEVRVQVNEIDRVVGITEREVSLLRELRTRLIADVVTGKLDVREAAARLPEEAEEAEPLDEEDAPAEDVEGLAEDLEFIAEEIEA